MNDPATDRHIETVSPTHAVALMGENRVSPETVAVKGENTRFGGGDIQERRDCLPVVRIDHHETLYKDRRPVDIPAIIPETQGLSHVFDPWSP